MIAALRHRNFRRLWLAGLLSKTGSEISRIGFFLYLFHARESVLHLALLVAVKTLPGALAAPVAGWLVDRFDKRFLMVACDILQAVLLALMLRWPSFPMLYTVAALQSMLSAVFEPAKRAAIPQLVPRRRLAAANGLEHSSGNLMMVFGPLLGAELFLNAGLTVTLWIDMLSFLASALLLTRLPLGTQRSGDAVNLSSARNDIREGWDYLSRTPVVLHLAMLLFVSMVCGGLWVPLAPFFIQDFLGASDRLLGFQLAAFGLGGVLGGLMAARLTATAQFGVVLFFALLAEAVQMIVYSLVWDPAASCAVLCAWGVAVSMIAVASHSLLQTHVEERFLGRVFALINQSENLAMLLAMGGAVLLQSRLASQGILLGAGLVYLITVMSSAVTPGGRRLRLAR